jgi:citrate lyase subunit beta / citryl-CoA lyase
MKRARSWLFVPGNHVRRMEKAVGVPADVLIFDLEDAVPLQEKTAARQRTEEAVRRRKKGVSFVRVNDPTTPFFEEDLEAVVGPGLAGIMLPKAAEREQVQMVDDRLSRLEEQTGLAKGSVQILPLIETAAGLQHAYEVATASGRVSCLAFGAVDFTLDIGARLTKEGTEILFARSQLVVISRAAGLEPPVDTVYVDLDDAEGFERDARLARQLGFQGKLVIHPTQVEIANRVFAPTPQEVEEAKTIAAAFEKALKAGQAAIQVGGKLVDTPVAHRACRVLDQAKELGLL